MIQARVMWLNAKSFFISSSCLSHHFLTLCWSVCFRECLELGTTVAIVCRVIVWKPLLEFLRRFPALKNEAQKYQLTFGAIQNYVDFLLGHTTTLKKKNIKSCLRQCKHCVNNFIWFRRQCHWRGRWLSIICKAFVGNFLKSRCLFALIKYPRHKLILNNNTLCLVAMI